MSVGKKLAAIAQRVAIATIALSLTAAAAPHNKKTLAEEMTARIHKLAPSIGLERSGPLSVRVINGPQAGSQVNFDRVADYCGKNDAAACEDIKRKFASSMAASIATVYSNVRPDQLRTVIRSTDYVAGSKSELKGKALVAVPFVEGVELVLAADYPKTTQLVSEDDLKNWA